MEEYFKKKNHMEEKKFELEESNYYSKIMKHIDDELTFDRAIKRIKIIKVINKDKLSTNKLQKITPKNKSTTSKKDEKKGINSYKTNTKVKDEDKKAYEESIFRFNKLSRIKRLTYLPKISPYIYNNNTSISIDYNKANEMGARGFSILCNNESDSIKEILFEYNDNNFKNIEDYNSCLRFNNINRQISSKNRDKEKIFINNNFAKNKMNVEDNGNLKTEVKNIFDKNYKTKKNVSKIRKILKNKSDRIKIRNCKYNKFLSQNKNKKLNKKIDNRIYKINYNAIEKHVPYTMLNSKTQRVFPQIYMKRGIFNDSTTKENNSETKNRILLKYVMRNNMLCSSNSLNSSANKNGNDKSNKKIYNLKNMYITRENMPLINNDNSNIIQSKTDTHN